MAASTTNMVNEMEDKLETKDKKAKMANAGKNAGALATKKTIFENPVNSLDTIKKPAATLKASLTIAPMASTAAASAAPGKDIS